MNDCLIIGGGVIGLSIAYELSGRGVRVRVIDSGQIGQKASWAGAGILVPAQAASAVDPLDQLRALSNDMHRAWSLRLREQTGIDNGYRECGGLYVARTAGETAALAAFAQILTEQQIAAQQVPLEQLVVLEPAFARAVQRKQIRAAFLLPGEAQLRNPRHLKALAAACLGQGVELIDARVEQFIEQAGCLARVSTSQGDFVADQYCIAAGAWSRLLLEQLDRPTGIFPVRGQMVMFHTGAPLIRHIVNEGPRYLVPRDDGRLLAGSTEEEVGYDNHTTEQGLATLKRFAFSLFEDLRHARIEHSWSGLRPGSFDGLPYLGTIPGLSNAFVAAGHFRSGLQLSTGTALVLSQLICGETPAIDLSALRIGRG